MPALLSDISVLKGVGDRKRKLFRNLGINTIGDLISFFPRRYEDRTVLKTINNAIPGEYVCILATVAANPLVSRVKNGIELLKFKVFDDTGSIDIIYFRSSYLRDRFETGKSYIFYGKIEEGQYKKSLINPDFEPEEKRGKITGHLISVYRQTSGLSSKIISSLVLQALDSLSEEFPSYLSEEIEKKYGFLSVKDSYRSIHFPGSFEEADLARKRFIFEELYVFTCSLNILRNKRKKETAEIIAVSDFSVFFSALPFDPTEAQKKAIIEAAKDMSVGVPMKRLLQGDVGSGKTLVAAALAWSVISSGFQVAFMAPTDLLSRQHLSTMKSFLEVFNIKVGLLCASMKSAEKRSVKESLREGNIDLIVGTHALLSEDVHFNRLGLIITDEQHRFGVRQRSMLSEKSLSPHNLVMSATPIPRSLALTIYGELDISILNELPKGRQKVSTFLVNESYRQRLNGFIRKTCENGQQVYIVCPMIEDSDVSENLNSAEKVYNRIKEQFSDITCGLCHGKQKQAEREAVMESFFENKTKILVSTTVIEVGVDVPNATLMVIENAERFGLSQLHQLRGRVGRGNVKSYCILVSESNNEESKKRFDILCKTNDGFKISEADLSQRGPGDFFGSRQHGLPEFKIADLCSNMEFLKTAQEEAFHTLKTDPELNYSGNLALKNVVLRFASNMSNMIN